MELTNSPNNKTSGKSLNPKNIIISLGLIFLIAGLYVLSRFNYPLFHSFADMLTVFIATGVFVVVWTRRHLMDNHFYLYIGIAFVFFAFLDFLHFLGNKGMGVFPQYGNLGPTFYIASRYVLSISFVIAPLFIRRKLNLAVVFCVYSLVVVLLLLSIFYWQNFPVTYVEGVGLTRFKIISDYIVCVVLLGAIGLLLLNRPAFDSKVLKLMVCSLVLSIATGLAFTLYSDPFGIMNVVGHFFQIASFGLVYTAFVETILTKPQDILYRNLKQSQERVIKLNSELEETNLGLKHDIAERLSAEEALKESEERFNRIFRSSPAAIAITKIIDGTFLDVNDSYERLMGYTREDVIGRSALELNIYPEQSRRAEMIRHLNEYGTLRDKEMTFRKKDGQFIDTILSSEVISVRNQNLILSTVIDITERKKAEESLRHYTSELEAANRELEAFSFSVSHDLRAPLRTLDGFSEAILEDYRNKIDETGKDYLNRIRQASQTMSHLIDDILKLSRVSRMEMHNEDVNLSDLAKSITEELKQAQPARQAAFVIAPDLNVKGDMALLRIGLNNLLGNSWKYTAKCPLAWIELGTLNQNSERIFFIRDNGIGFDMQYADKLFQPFQRLHTSKDYPGTGIGLATVQRVIRRHGGKIWAEAELDKGATFYFTLGE
jgi:PAS domain S-box-containing protein